MNGKGLAGRGRRDPGNGGTTETDLRRGDWVSFGDRWTYGLESMGEEEKLQERLQKG